MREMRIRIALQSLIAIFLCSAEIEASATEDTTIDWSLELVATFDLLANLSGGRKRGIEAPSTAEVIGDLVWGDPDHGSAHHIKLNVLGTIGGHLSADHVGDIQTASSIEAANTGKLFEAWYEYSLPEKRASLLLGLHDANTEFYVLERASSLVHSSFGNGPEISQGNVSIFPVTALGAVLRLAPSEQTYLSTAVYDGVPGSPTDKFGTHIRFDDGDGVFLIGEFGYLDTGQAIPAKAAIGLWHSTANFEDIAGLRRDNNSGGYIITEMPLTYFRADGDLGIFFQYGLARASRNQISSYFGGGLHWAAPLSGRSEDQLSVGIAHARLSDKHRRAEELLRKAETAIELTYAYQVNSWLVLQPDIQLVVDPGSANGIDDAVVAGVRIVLELP